MENSTSFPTRTRQRPAPYAIDDTSLGWLIVGASAVADQFAVDALRNQSPLPANRAVNSWITGIHSHHAGRAQQFAFKHLIPHSSDDLPALLYREHVQCVYVANHPRHHFESVRAALSAGKHVLCEPPIAPTVDEAQILAEIAEHNQLRLGINFVHRNDPEIVKLKALLQREQIGELIGGRLRNTLRLETRQRTWRLQPEVGGVLLHRTLFDIDLLRFLFDDEVEAVQALSQTRVHTDRLDEDLQATLRFQKRKFGLTLYDSFLVPHADSQLELFGTNGSAIVSRCLNLQGPSILSLVKNDQSEQPLAPEGTSPENQRFSNAFADFNHAVRTKGKPAAEFSDFVAALRVIEAARRSLSQSHWTPVIP